MKARDFVEFLEKENLMDAKIECVDFSKGVMRFYPNYYQESDQPELRSVVQEFLLQPTQFEWVNLIRMDKNGLDIRAERMKFWRLGNGS